MRSTVDQIEQAVECWRTTEKSYGSNARFRLQGNGKRRTVLEAYESVGETIFEAVHARSDLHQLVALRMRD